MAGTLGPDAIAGVIGEYSGAVFTIIWAVAQILIILGVVGWFIVMWRYDTRVLVSELTKNKKVINYHTRAREIIDRQTKTPKVKLFGTFGFGGEEIEKPPSECITPFKSRVTNKMYHYVKKDGLYWPVQNLVLGHKYLVNDKKTGKQKEVYSLEGSGLEINRDYDAEEAINNNLINAAIKYRNKDQRNQIYLSYGLMIITIVIAGVMMLYSIKQFGALSIAIDNLREPLKEGLAGALQQKLGPG
jgi:hypothetical protein